MINQEAFNNISVCDSHVMEKKDNDNGSGDASDTSNSDEKVDDDTMSSHKNDDPDHTKDKDHEVKEPPGFSCINLRRWLRKRKKPAWG